MHCLGLHVVFIRIITRNSLYNVCVYICCSHDPPPCTITMLMSLCNTTQPDSMYCWAFMSTLNLFDWFDRLLTRYTCTPMPCPMSSLSFFNFLLLFCSLVSLRASLASWCFLHHVITACIMWSSQWIMWSLHTTTMDYQLYHNRILLADKILANVYVHGMQNWLHVYHYIDNSAWLIYIHVSLHYWPTEFWLYAANKKPCPKAKNIWGAVQWTDTPSVNSTTHNHCIVAIVVVV